MNTDDFKRIYDEPRNGANGFYNYPLAPKFAISDGVKALADTGIYWLIDIAATELVPILKSSQEVLGILVAEVKDPSAQLNFLGSGDKVLWTRHIPFTDMPEGRWVFALGDDGPRVTMILLSEY